MFTRIVIPLDGSELAERALPQAEELARLTGAPLHLVRVDSLTNYSQYGTYVALEAAAYAEALESAEAVITQYLVEVQRRLAGRGLTVTVEYRRGDPTQEIVALTQPGDLIVMATHGRSGLGRVVLGSVAEAVVRRAPAPVLLVRADTKQPVDPVGDRIVAGVGPDQRVLACEPW